MRETRRDACQVSLRLRERENEKGVVSFISHFYRDRCKFHLQPPDFHGIVSHFGPFSFLVFNFGFLLSIRFESRLSSSTLFCIVFLLTPVILKKSLFSFFLSYSKSHHTDDASAELFTSEICFLFCRRGNSIEFSSLDKLCIALHLRWHLNLFSRCSLCTFFSHNMLA